MSKPVLTYVGIGSNLNNPLQQVNDALVTLKNNGQIKLLRRSPWYGSKAVGPGEQADYVNGVIELETNLEAHQLLACLQGIETQQGRVRTLRWGARTLDLDILLYSDQCLDTQQLQIPHPRIRERAFVLAPLSDLKPDMQIPDPKGEKSATIATLLSHLPLQDSQSVWLLKGEHDAVFL